MLSESDFENLDALVRNGEGEKVTQVLSRASTGDIPAHLITAAASLARRTNLPLIAIRWLYPQAKQHYHGKPVPGETLLEYAACLVKLGAIYEAEGLLHTLIERKTKGAYFHIALSKMISWEYRAAIPYLKTFLSQPDIPSYYQVVAGANLLVAYVHEEMDNEIEELLAPLCSETLRHPLLHSYVLQLRAEWLIQKRELPEAENCLQKSLQTLPNPTPYERLLNLKWRTVAGCELNRNAEHRRLSIAKLRAQALAVRHWETLRDTDRLEAVYTRNVEAYQRVFFGTPYESYRRWLVKQSHELGNLPEFYVHYLRPDTSGQILRLVDCVLEGKGQVFRPMTMEHLILDAMTSDFYRPIPLGQLYHFLYPDKPFNPVMGTNRIHQRLTSFRKLVVKRNLPFLIRERNNLYRLMATQSIGIQVEASRSAGQSVMDFRLLKLRHRFPARPPLSLSQMSKVLCISLSSTRRTMKEALAEGKVERLGEAKTTRYRIVATVGPAPATSFVKKKTA